MSKIQLKNVQALENESPVYDSESGYVNVSGEICSGIVGKEYYTYEEFLSLFLEGLWTGGYVDGVYTQNMNEVVVTPNNNGTGSGGGYGGGTSINTGGNNTGNQGTSGNSTGNNAGNTTNATIIVYNNGGKQILKKGSIILTINKNAQYLSEIIKEKFLNLQNYNGTIVITSTSRTPREQAKAMLDNIRLHGINSQLELYGPNGDQVINVYSPQRTYAENLNLMEQKIYELGPDKVSHHCCDFNVKNVVDVSVAQTTNFSLFMDAIYNAGFDKIIDERHNNGCIHLEINLQ